MIRLLAIAVTGAGDSDGDGNGLLTIGAEAAETEADNPSTPAPVHAETRFPAQARLFIAALPPHDLPGCGAARSLPGIRSRRGRGLLLAREIAPHTASITGMDTRFPRSKPHAKPADPCARPIPTAQLGCEAAG